MMYDPHVVLGAIDAHKFNIIAFCGGAMVFNYIWFYLAVRQGFKDQVFPVPILNTLFWLCGDGTGVTRYSMYFVQYDHWYLKLFWAALIFTVSFEIYFIWMTLKFGRKELLPHGSQGEFTALMVAAAAIFGITWYMVLGAMPDDLNIVYFNIANMAGPIAMAGLIMRRGSTAGTTSTVWVLYTLMLACWYFAQAMWFGPEFRTPAMLTFMAINMAASAGLAHYIRRQEASSASGAGAGAGLDGRAAAAE